MKVLVTGGTGFVGKRLVCALVALGYSVDLLTRKEILPSALAVTVIRGDLAASDGLDSLDAQVPYDIIFHCAGEIKNDALMSCVHVDGTRRLLDFALKVAEKNGRPIHWVQLSSVGAYGPPQGRADVERVITETTQEAPVGEYEITKTESDHLVVAAAKSGRLTYSILRPSNIIGPEMTASSIRKLITVVRRGVFFYVGKPGAIATYVHVDDVVHALIKCATDVRAHGQVYDLSSDCLLEDLIDWIAQAVGVKAPRVRLPEGLVRPSVRALSRIISLPLTQKLIDGLVCRTRYFTGKIETQLGFRLSHPMPEAMREMISSHANPARQL